MESNKKRLREGAAKWSDLPYMTKVEAARLKRLRDTGALSVFHIIMCENPGCQNEVAKIKPEDGAPGSFVKEYCSEECYLEDTEVVDDEEGEE